MLGKLIVGAQKYAKKYIGSVAGGTKVHDEQQWVAEYTVQLVAAQEFLEKNFPGQVLVEFKDLSVD